MDEHKQGTSATEVVKKLRCHFARYGSPLVIVSDNGPQYSAAECKNFCKQWNTKHQTVSPRNSQTNGAAEAAVKIVKRILRKSKASGEDPTKELLT